MNDTDLKDLEEIRQKDAYKILKEKLTDEQILFVWRTFSGNVCGSCWNQGPYCCYDSGPYE